MEKKISGKHGNRVAVMKERMAAVVLASALLLGGGLTAKAQNTAVTTCSQSAATAIQQNPNWKANAAEWQKLKGTPREGWFPCGRTPWCNNNADGRS